MKIQSNSRVGGYLDLWNRPSKAQSSVIDLKKSGGKRRNTLEERKAKRAAGRSHMVTDWSGEEPMDEAVNY